MEPSAPQTLSKFHSSQHIPALDGVRGLAILLVLIWHYFTAQLMVAPNQGRPVVLKLIEVTMLSWSGVDLFFVLSGFLIAGILFDYRQARNYFQVFYLRRICRIFPLYYLMLLLFVLISALLPVPRFPGLSWLLDQTIPIWSYATFTQNLVLAGAGQFSGHWLAITWSLAVEEQFYLLFPLMVRYAPSASLPWLLWGGLIGAPVLRTFVGPGPAYWWMPFRMDALFAGALLAYYLRQPGMLDRLRQIPTRAYLAGLAVLAAYVVVKADPNPMDRYNKLLLAILYGALLLALLVDQQSLLARSLQVGWLRWLGRVSFGIYMLHESVGGLAHSLVSGHAPQMTTPLEGLTTLVALAVTLLLAHLLYHRFEKPILAIGHRYSYHMP